MPATGRSWQPRSPPRPQLRCASQIAFRRPPAPRSIGSILSPKGSFRKLYLILMRLGNIFLVSNYTESEGWRMGIAWEHLARANTHPLRVSILEVIGLDEG